MFYECYICIFQIIDERKKKDSSKNPFDPRDSGKKAPLPSNGKDSVESEENSVSASYSWPSANIAEKDGVLRFLTDEYLSLKNLRA